MKHILVLLVFTLCFASCKNNTTPETISVDTQTATAQEETKTVDLAANYNKAEFKIDGMTCAIGCAKRIEGKLAALDGVKSATVDFENKIAMVEYNEAKVDFEALTATVAKVPGDYKVSDIKNVDAFAKTCKEDCKKECCNKTKEEKMACAKNCKKACCAKKA